MTMTSKKKQASLDEIRLDGDRGVLSGKQLPYVIGGL